MANSKKIERFTPAVRVAHWVHTLSFFALALTGYLLYGDLLDWMAPLFGGIKGAQIVHRVAAVGFVIPVVLVLLISPKEFFLWVKEVITIRKEDIAFIKAFPYKFLGIKTKLPPQGFYNGGEKINSILIMLTSIFLTITGLIMWFPDYVPLGLLQLAYPIHAIAMAGSVAVIFGHIYIALFNPVSKGAIWGMITGQVSERYLRENHGKWYEEQYGQNSKSNDKSMKL